MIILSTVIKLVKCHQSEMIYLACIRQGAC